MSDPTVPPPLSILQCLEGKNIFITGGTGFVGKAVIEKILRSVPNCGCLYLLVRGRKGISETDRVQREIVQSEIFNRLRSERKDFDAFINRKLVVFPGELTRSELGISPKNIRFLQRNTHIFIHLAAITDFNERIDRAIELNVLGTMRVFALAQQCQNLKAFIHTSTCYVNANKRGWIDERIYDLGFDPEAVLSKVQTMTSRELEKVTGSGMDWPNTYTFTKSLAEHLLMIRRGTTPLAIVRPSIVGSAIKEPVPGWVDVITAAGAVYVAVGLGVLNFLPGKPNAIADVVPVDYVVNAILAMIPAVYERDHVEIVHAASSAENAMHWGHAIEAIPNWYKDHRPARAMGPAKFDFVSSQTYQLKFFAQYSVPSALLNSLSAVGNSSTKAKAALFNKLVWRVRVLVESFRFFVENEWKFDNRNLRAIYKQLSDEDQQTFPLKLSEVNWSTYNREFAYGLQRFVLKEELVTLQESSEDTVLQFDPWTPFQPAARGYFPNAHWSVRKFRERKKMSFKQPRAVKDMIKLVVGSEEVQGAIRTHVEQNDTTTHAETEQAAKAAALRMFGEPFSSTVLSSMGFVLRNLWQRLYKAVTVNTEGIKMLQDAAKKGPLIYMPTHRSYIDFLMASFMCYNCDLPLPYIAAGEDFLGIAGVRWMFRNAGAFFIRRSFSKDKVYSALFSQYVVQLLQDGQSLEFFIEGTRSRSGKMLHPKLGMLGILTEAAIQGRIPDCYICPLSINYERTIESGLYSNELSGNNKIKESLSALLKSRSILKTNFGSISLTLAKPRSLKETIQGIVAEVQTLGYVPTPFFPTPQQPLPPAPLIQSDFKFDPMNTVAHKQYLDRRLGYSIVWDQMRHGECMPTHLVSALMLMYRNGVTKDVLVEKVHWLVREIRLRGGRVRGYEMEHKTKLVENAVEHLKATIAYRSQTILEPIISARENYNNMLYLGQYKNKIVSYFFLESIWCCALYAFGDKMERGVDKAELLKDVRFLFALLGHEFHVRDNPDAPGRQLEDTLDQMVTRGILTVSSDNLVSLPDSGETHFSFLCNLLWPFVDSYYVSAMVLFSLQPNRSTTETALLQRTQWLAQTLYYELMVSFYESCSSDTLRNAFSTMQKWGVLHTVTETRGGKLKKMIQLTEHYQNPPELTRLVQQIDRLRKRAPVRKSDGGRLIADIPILAKL